MNKKIIVSTALIGSMVFAMSSSVFAGGACCGNNPAMQNYSTSQNSNQAYDQNVFIVQQKLMELGFSTHKPDGVYGAKTKAALQNFQNEYDLTETGKINQLTLDSLCSLAYTNKNFTDSLETAANSQSNVSFAAPNMKNLKYSPVQQAASDSKTAKENYLKAMEAKKSYLHDLFGKELISQTQYDQALANIQQEIDYVTQNELTIPNWGYGFGYGYGCFNNGATSKSGLGCWGW